MWWIIAVVVLWGLAILYLLYWIATDLDKLVAR
jgi:hypothetical protein